MARPKGSENKDKPFREALRIELAAIGDDQRGLRRIAKNLIKLAGGESDQLDGGLAAIKEIADRLDGKPAQESTVHVTRAKAAEISDDDLADIAAGSGTGATEAPLDPSQLN